MKNYCDYKTDIDGSSYLEIKRDVMFYHKGINKDVDAIVEKYSNLTDGLWIRGNAFFFTFKKVKYSLHISCHEEEWWNSNKIMNDLNCVKGVSQVVYKHGRLD